MAKTMKERIKEAEKKAKSTGVLPDLDYKAMLSDLDETKLGKAAAKKMAEQKKKKKDK